MLQTRRIAIDKKCIITCLDLNIDSMLSKLGPSQLMLLLQNLIGNAIKYCEAEVPTVHIGARELDGQFEFFVQDNGIGIDTRFHERIFQVFQRLHNREEYSGTGIGLSICHKIVERFEGKIWVESAVGTGSTFKFTLNKLEDAVDDFQ
ncbi:MAG: ATP-binding protein [Pirellulaceae bacterium]